MDESTNPPPKKRPWYRLHLSTWFVALLTLTLMTIIVIPGSITHEEDLFTADVLYLKQHGWPFVHFDSINVETLTPINNAGNQPIWDPQVSAKYFKQRVEELSTLNENRRRLRLAHVYEFGMSDRPMPNILHHNQSWTVYSNWSYSGEQVQLNKWGLTLNAMTALLICCLMTASFEWWQRRRKRRLWQFSLRELIVFLIIISIALGWWAAMASGYHREEKLIANVNDHQFNTIRQNFAPIWMQKLFGTKVLWPFERVVAIRGPMKSVVDGIPMLDPERHTTETMKRIERGLDAADKYRYLQRITLYLPNDLMLKKLENVSRFTSLTLDYWNGSEEGAKSISRMSSLENLTIDGYSFINTEENHFTDNYLIHLLQNKNLRVLTLNISLTDGSVIHLKKMTWLKELNIRDTQISQEGVESLRRALPDTQIID